MSAAVALVSLFSAVAANRRSTYIQVTDNADAFLMNTGEPPHSVLRAKLTTKLSDLIVTDENCGEQVTNCPRFCRNAQFSKLYCFPLCFATDSRTMLCKYKTHRYYPAKSSTSLLIENRSWRRSLANFRPLWGSRWSDTIRLQQFWRSATPIMENLRVLNLTFVSALTFDSRLIVEATALLGLRPGADSAAEQLLRQIGAEKRIISLANARPLDMVKTMVDNGLLYLTLGAVDQWRCIDWRWVEAPDFVVKIPTVDFMGVLFHNVVMPFDLDNEYYHISKPMADALVAADVFRFSRENHDFIVYTFDCDDDLSVRFLDADDRPFLELYSDALQMVDTDCESTVTVDHRDISADPRAEHLIWNMGFGFMYQSCLAFDYERNMAGFAMLRPWAHPLFVSYGNDDDDDDDL